MALFPRRVIAALGLRRRVHLVVDVASDALLGRCHEQRLAGLGVLGLAALEGDARRRLRGLFLRRVRHHVEELLTRLGGRELEALERAAVAAAILLGELRGLRKQLATKLVLDVGEELL